MKKPAEFWSKFHRCCKETERIEFNKFVFELGELKRSLIDAFGHDWMFDARERQSDAVKKIAKKIEEIPFLSEDRK